MSKKPKNPKPSIAPQEALERFVIRARRVQAHSLVQDGTVEKYAQPRVTVTMAPSTGRTTLKEHVIEDEEALESLATRLRPFIVGSDPIYLSKVFKAIRASVSAEAISEDEKLERCLVSAEHWFEHRYEKKDSKAYAVQLLDKDENPQTGYLSDALLAESWVYTDTVHADPRGEKAEGEKLGYLQRYTAASSYFSEFARIIVSLLNIVKALAERGHLSLADTVWNEPVTYTAAEKEADEKLVDGSMYIFPAGTEPSSGVKISDIPNGVKATPMVMDLISDPEGKATLQVLDGDDNRVATYAAYRGLADDSFYFLIADVLELTVPRAVLTGQANVPFEFSLVSGMEDKALALLNLMAAPHTAELYFQYDKHRQRLKIRLEKNTGEKDLRPA